MSSRCTGACCEIFVLPLLPKELWENYDMWLKRSREEPIPLDHPPIIEDIYLIAPMAIYLGSEVGVGDGLELTEEAAAEATTKGEREYHTYTCRHFNLETRDCDIYERRPKMCRAYPYGRKCERKNCTMTTEAIA